MNQVRTSFSLSPNLLQSLRAQARLSGTTTGRLCEEAVSRYLSECEGDAPSALSLFSGGGGLDLGIEAAGFRTLASIEIDEQCCATLRANQPQYHSSSRIIHSDVAQCDPVLLMEQLGIAPGALGLLYGGPPCQTFSQIGKRGSLSDDRGLLVFQMVRYAKAIRPKAILIENVRGLMTARDLSGEKGGVMRRLREDLSALGYRVEASVLNAADFGVPQKRLRAFILAIRGEGIPSFPEPTHAINPNGSGLLEYARVGEVLKGLGKPSSREHRDRRDGHVDVTPARDRERISYVPEGGHLASQDAPSEILRNLKRRDTTKFLRLNRKGLSNTLRCGEIFYHPQECRYLTPREYMRIHGYPDDYYLTGPIRGRTGTVRNLDQHRQVANSVPPPLAKALAEEVLSLLTSRELEVLQPPNG